jgi:hypothetical protein
VFAAQLDGHQIPAQLRKVLLSGPSIGKFRKSHPSVRLTRRHSCTPRLRLTTPFMNSPGRGGTKFARTTLHRGLPWHNPSQEILAGVCESVRGPAPTVRARNWWREAISRCGEEVETSLYRWASRSKPRPGGEQVFFPGQILRGSMWVGCRPNLVSKLFSTIEESDEQIRYQELPGT